MVAPSKNKFSFYWMFIMLWEPFLICSLSTSFSVGTKIIFVQVFFPY